MQLFQNVFELKNFQFKTIRYGYTSMQMNPIVIANKNTIDMQQLERKAHKHITKESY